MKKLVVCFLSGALFASGLMLAGVTRPATVLAFLSPLGSWDPRLLLMFAAAVAVHGPLLWWIRRRRSAPVLADRFRLPERRSVDGRLVAGAAVFGLGWGLSGICPGPAITAVGGAGVELASFLVTMFLGMALYRVVHERAGLRMTTPPPGTRPVPQS